MIQNKIDRITCRKRNPSSSEIPIDAHTRMQIYSCNEPTQQPNKLKTYVRSLQINRIEELELFCIFTLQSDHLPWNPSPQRLSAWLP